MSRSVSRRDVIAGVSAGAGLLLAGCNRVDLPPTYGSLLGIGEAFTYASHRVLLRRQSLVREFGRDALSPDFPAINAVDPQDADYQRMRRRRFIDYRLRVGGLVDHPETLSLADLRRMPARTQVTQHNCEQGWSAIGEWTGVQLSRVLAAVGVRENARYILFRCVDGWWDSIDMLDALHPQTLLAYGMNGRDLPVRHGAPLRLRVERQLGYKSLKFVTSLKAVDSLQEIEDGSGAFVVRYGYSWYAGI